MSNSASARRITPEVDRETCVNKVSQGELFAEIGSSHRDRWRNFLRVFAEEVDRIGLKKVAGELDEKASVIGNAIAERDRHYVHAEWLLWVIAHGPTDEPLRFLAALRGRDVVTPEVMSPEEELTRTKQALAKLFGQGGADLIRKEVYGK